MRLHQEENIFIQVMRLSMGKFTYLNQVKVTVQMILSLSQTLGMVNMVRVVVQTTLIILVNIREHYVDFARCSLEIKVR